MSNINYWIIPDLQTGGIVVPEWVKEQIIAEYLKAPEGSEKWKKLAEAMAQPIKDRLDNRRTWNIPVNRLPPGEAEAVMRNLIQACKRRPEMDKYIQPFWT